MRLVLRTTTTTRRGHSCSIMLFTASSSKRKAWNIVEIIMSSRKRLRTATMTQETYWMEVLCLMEVDELRTAELSRVAADREEQLTGKSWACKFADLICLHVFKSCG